VSWVLGAYLKSIKFTDKVYVIGNESMGKELDNANIKVRASNGMKNVKLKDLTKILKF